MHATRDMQRPKRLRQLWCALAFCLLHFAFTLPVFALTPATLLGPDLEPQRVRVQGLIDGTLTYFDAERRLQTTPLRNLLQLRFDAGATQPGGQGEAALAPAAGAALVLTDGQRLTGRWAGADPDGQTVHWDNPMVGQVQVRLDDLAAVEVSGAAGAQTSRESAGADRVVFANGDQLDGFVTSASAGGIVLETASGAKMELPLERIASVTLANPARQPDAGDATAFLVTFADGTRLASSNLQISGDELTLVPTLHRSAQPVTMPLALVRRVETVSAGQGAGTLVELLDLPMSVTNGGRVFGAELPPRRVDGGLRLHAPVTVRFELPPGATRLAADARLDVSDASRIDWADFEIVVRVDGKVAGRYPINARTPSASINVPADGLEATIELREGANGPIMDRLRLSDAVVLVRRTTPE